jgi:acyl-CoA thioesterase
MTLDDVPFAKLLGLEVESVEPGVATLSMKMRDDLKRNGGIAHGGAVATLIDSAMAFAIMPLLGENEHSMTVDLTIHYLRPVSEGSARATARVVRAGKRVITVSAELFDGNEKLAATAISTYLRVI